MNADAAAAHAARLRAAANAATLRIGHSSAASSSDHAQRQTVRRPAIVPQAPEAAATDTHHENRVRTVTAFARSGPSPLFLAQKIAQETRPSAGESASRAQVATAYPSLTSDQEIFLPGETVAFLAASPRVDFYI